MPISRTHRPQRFSDVTGQDHITETLRREMAQGLIGHAYLFSGPRGVGKTTSARIFAKALLCERPKEGEPCNECDACHEVTAGNCIDVAEMDAASHTGVDNVREAIVEHVRFSPVRWKRKIYVIDEAHMLSTSAWNALLKTLEEPPDYAVFILATTEIHKVPATILSRCQRFEFKRIAAPEMTKRIQRLAKAEGVSLHEDVVAALVRSADGYLRDAESLLEQLLSLGEKKITPEVAGLVLPASRLPDAATLLGVCAERKVADALQSLRHFLDSGTAPMPFFDDLLAVVRLLIRTEDPAEAKVLAAGDEGARAVHALMGRYAITELGDIALLLIERRRDAKSGVDPVFALELAVVGIATRGSASTPPLAQNAVVARIAPAPASVPAPRQVASPTPEPLKVVPATPMAPVVAERTEPPAVVPSSDIPDLSLHDVLIKWREVIRVVEKENRSLPFVLKITQPEAIRGSTIVLRFQYPFHQEKIIGELKSRRIVETAIRSVFDRPDLLIDGVVGDLVGESDRPTTTDIVSKVLNAFGGTVVE